MRFGRPVWNGDDPADAQRIIDNIRDLMGAVRAHAERRGALTARELCDWHTKIYAGCNVPSASFVGNFRGDPGHRDLVGYEVDVDGLHGTEPGEVAAEIVTFFTQAKEVLRLLDGAIPLGAIPTISAEIDAVASAAGLLHGEWIRIHPFANGNGRTARLIAAHVALRYGMPVFVTLKPRPADSAYMDAARTSMLPPTADEFDPEHTVTVNFFINQLALMAVRLHNEERRT